MKDFAIIIKKNNIKFDTKKDYNFYLKSILYYGLSICENNILFLDLSNSIEDFYYNIVCIKEFALSILTISKRNLYIYIDNSDDDLLENTYSSYYFYTVLELFICKTIFIQYADIIIYEEPIFKYYLNYNIKSINVEISETYHNFNSSFIIVDNYNIDDLILNIIDLSDVDLDFFSFILNNIKCTIYSNILISKNSYLYKRIFNEDLCIFKCDNNPLIKNYLYSIYKLNNEILDEL